MKSVVPGNVSSTSRLQSWVINGVVALTVLVAVAGIFFLADWTQRLLVKHFHGSPSVPLLVIAAALVLSLLFGASRKDNRWLAWEVIRSVFFDFPRALLVSREAAIHLEASSEKPPRLALSLARNTRFRGFPHGKPAVEIWSAELALPALADAHAAVSAALPALVVTGINDLERGFVVHRLVPIVVARSESVLPWEAYLRLALSPARTTSHLWLYRPVPTTQSDRLRSSAVGLTLIHEARYHWAQTLWSVSPQKQVDRGGIVHAIGIPIRMSSGIRLQIGRDDPEGRRVGKQFSRSRLLVLQLPVVDSLVRGATDRQQVADLRELAFETALSGTPFVLVLPALTKEGAVLLITPLVKQLGDKEPSLDLMLGITEHLRSLLLRPKDPHAAELAELAFDITLFAAESGPLQGGKTKK